MTKFKWIVLSWVFLFPIINVFAQANEISLRFLKSDMEFLADDLLEGRETASRGEKIASLYIANELNKYGIKPFGDSGSYFQNFKLDVSGIGDDCSIQVFQDGTAFKLPDTNFIFNKRIFPSNEFANIKSQLVYASFGIVDEELKIDSYKSIDVKGKIVIVSNGIPFIEGEEIDKNKIRAITSSEAKIKNAQDRGAVGVVFVIDERYKRFWKFLLKYSNSLEFEIQTETKKEEKNIPSVILTEEGMRDLFQNEKYSFDQINEIITDNRTPQAFSLNKEIELNFNVIQEQRNARNVIGILPGKDEELKNEFVTIGAHYDHLGMRDSIVYNGADDDASGTVTVLETARKLALTDDNDRSIVFIFHTGEEKGLLGSSYLTSHTQWLDNAVVNINIDMVGRESIDTIYSIGSEKLSTQLKMLVEEVNDEGNYFTLNYKFDDPNDPNRFYYRSDHYNYAQLNIPIVFFYDYMQQDYHRETDTADKIDYLKILKMTNFVHDLATEISNMDSKFIIDGSEINNDK